MGNANGGLTLEGLAQILRDHMDANASEFAESRARFDAVGARIDDLRNEIGLVANLVRDLGQVVFRQVDQLEEYRRQGEEHRQQIRQIYARMEEHDARLEQLASRMVEHDARFEAIARDIRRILDAMDRRGGNGGSRGE